ncbi:GNAT family N-acetyltransferase [Helcococcus kunzii]|uniref:GNAT family N-acetyltransferase n=1 Tax=Helcococcus kunzii TaxID=40091 RepID=UPI0021A7EA3D|nr:GNAT family N-acetyltransferase [Helcococcus kunzii]MCT1796919.1 GNAT family N-acetyltransferase [Helcococcus kunzii]MCT1988523.1 GNAT family N-acetyltransferase [Helcococcus kunzii]
MIIRKTSPKDNQTLAKIIRKNLEEHHLDIAGMAYFDSNLDNLSEYYNQLNTNRVYYVILDDNENLLGGVGMEAFENIDNCVEMQKLYLSDEAKGQGLGVKLVQYIEEKAKEQGYSKMYLESHSNLKAAISLYKKMGYK